MTARQIVAVGLRLFALWLCLAAFQLFWTAQALKKMTAEWGDPSVLGLSLVGLCVAIAAVVWVMSGPLSRWLVSGLGKMEKVRLSTVDLLAVGCMLMGLWWLKEALFPLIRLWINAVAFASESGESAFRWLGNGGKITVAVELLQIVVAGFFVRCAYPIACWLLRQERMSSRPEQAVDP
jgi:Na+/phosphate symporter